MNAGIFWDLFLMQMLFAFKFIYLVLDLPFWSVLMNCRTAINLAILLNQGGVRPKNVAIICCWCNGRYLQIDFCFFFCENFTHAKDGHVWCMVANLVEPFISLDACKNKELPSTYPVLKNFLKAGIWGDRRKDCREDVGKGAAGSVFVQWRVRIYEMTNWHMLQHDFISSYFNLIQDWTHGTLEFEACKINFPSHPFPISKVWFWGFPWFSEHA